MLANRLSGWLRPLLTLAALAGVLSLAACGGGNGAPNNPYQPGAGPLTVTPATGTGYSGVPFTFSVTGGTAPYSVISSDSVILPVTSGVSGNSLVVVPGNVTATTPVSFTVSDAAGHQTTGSLTVNPALLLPTSITVTGNPTCSASGGTLCSGQNGTASVFVTNPAGGPLAGRTIRFDVVQGDFAFVSTAAGQPLVSTLSAVSDTNGFAVVKLQVPTTAITQIATIRATDVTSGNSINSNFTIVAFNDGGAVLSVSPASASVPGLPAATPQCAIGVPVTYYVYGGTPPYTVAANLPSLVSITGTPVTRSGGGFTVRALNCVSEILTITDASGLFVNATFASVLGPTTTSGGTTTGDCSTFSPPNPSCPTVSPSSLSLTACTGAGSSATATISGGTTPYTAAAPSGVTATVSGTTLTVTRASGTVTTPLTVQV